MHAISLELKPEVEKILRDTARKTGMNLNKICEIILSTWATHGGSVWMGRQRFVVDWPIEAVYLKKEEPK
jgi:hypothetical protein